jgi:hypothetical protein
MFDWVRNLLGVPIKKCGCGRKFTPSRWKTLKDLGTQVTQDETYNYYLELRNCLCGSTIGIERRKRRKA